MADIKTVIQSKYSIVLVLMLLFPSKLSAEFPRIQRLDRSDAVYAQLEETISAYYRAVVEDTELPALQLYSYATKEKVSIFALSSRLNLTYESLATLNRFDQSRKIEEGTTVLIPNIPGLFVPFEAENELEHLLQQSMEREQYESYPIVIDREDKKTPYHFIPGRRFTSEELSFFLGVYFHNPLPPGEGSLSSLFGQRRNPFSGDLQFHYGVDIAADSGTKVTAARFGKVIKKGYDDIYGYYVLIEHSDNYKSLYGHLSYITVELNQTVKSDSIIGTVGSTGISTGPHLHFEIWQNDTAVDPLLILPKDY